MRKRRGRSAARSTRKTRRQQRSASSPAPSLAELRRRATARLRKLSSALSAMHREHLDAVAECERLRAALPRDIPEVPLAPAQPACDREQAPAAIAAAEDAERLLSRSEALEEKVNQAAQALAKEQARGGELEALGQELARQLHAAEESLATEQARASALEVRAADLQARLDKFEREDARSPEQSPAAWSSRAAALEADLTRAQAANTHIREEMKELLNFLDELTSILSVSGEAATPQPEA